MPYTPPSAKRKGTKPGTFSERVDQGGGPLELGTGWGPPQEVFTPHRDPTGLGSPPA